jgi:hypothetical protein
MPPISNSCFTLVAVQRRRSHSNGSIFQQVVKGFNLRKPYPAIMVFADKPKPERQELSPATPSFKNFLGALNPKAHYLMI